MCQLFMSALNKQRIYKAIETAVEAIKLFKEGKDFKLNSQLPIIENFSPPVYKGKFIKIIRNAITHTAASICFFL